MDIEYISMEKPIPFEVEIFQIYRKISFYTNIEVSLFSWNSFLKMSFFCFNSTVAKSLIRNKYPRDTCLIFETTIQLFFLSSLAYFI